VVTYAQLRTARPDAWQLAAAALRRMAAVVVSRADEIGAQLVRLRSGWSGPAAEAALRQLQGLADVLAELHPVLLAADQILSEHSDTVAHAQRALDAALASAVAPLRPGVSEAVELAAAADLETTARLRALTGSLPAAAPVAPAWTPSPGSDPAEVHRWWGALGESQRSWMLLHDPARLGQLDGVPSATRDQANRLVLTRERDRLQRLRTVSDKTTRASLDATLRGLDAIAARLDRDHPARAYLLGLDVTGDGRAIVAVGDPDRATDVLTYVPGAGARLATAGGLLGATDRMAAHGTGAAAVVLWLGYDAPDDPLAAASAPSGRAQADLDRFADGLRATHEGDRAHLSVLGHSYGSALVGYTAAGHGLAAYDLVFVGSPGVGVAHATALGVPAGHVWSTTAAFDPIRFTGLPRDLPASVGPRWPPGAGDSLWFGADPSRSGFGGQVFASDPGSPLHPIRTHNGYFDDRNDALDDIAAIAEGRYGAVR
jgi:hypothetical protein